MLVLCLYFVSKNTRPFGGKSMARIMMQSWVGLDLCIAFSVILNIDWMRALTHISDFIQLRSFFPSVFFCLHTYIHR